MNKSRVESFSDGVFSIVMTLLIFDLKLPAFTGPIPDDTLWSQLATLSPLIAVYFLSFAVLSTLWINHHFLFHTFAKSVDRGLNLLNLTYLAFVAFVPFSAYLIGTYHHNQPAALIYGLNIFCIVGLSTAMMRYIRKHPDVKNEMISQRLQNQAKFRAQVSLFCYLVGIMISFLYVPATLFFFAFPVIFNIVPGTLDLTERIFGLDLG